MTFRARMWRGDHINASAPKQVPSKVALNRRPAGLSEPCSRAACLLDRTIKAPLDSDLKRVRNVHGKVLHSSMNPEVFISQLVLKDQPIRTLKGSKIEAVENGICLTTVQS